MDWSGGLGTSDSGLSELGLGTDKAAEEGLERTATDTLSLSESVTGRVDLFRTAEDTFSFSESVSTGGLDRTVEDTLSFSDSVDGRLDLFRSAEDTLSLSESVAGLLEAQRSADDSLSLSESVVAGVGLERTADDTTTVSEAVVGDVSQQRTATDTASFSESVSGQLELFRTADDSLAFADFVDIGNPNFRTATENLGGGGGAENAFQSDAFQSDAFQITEGGGFFETVSRQVNFFRSADDTLSFSESIVAEVGALFERTATDTLTLTESVDGLRTYQRTLTDTLTFSDTVDRLFIGSRALVENIPTNETLFPLTVVDEDVYGDVPTGYMPVITSPIGPATTTVTVSNPVTVDVPFQVTIGGVVVTVTAVVGNTWTIEPTGVTIASGTFVQAAHANFLIGGVDVTGDVDYRRTRLQTMANGQAGTGEIWVRDLERTRSFVSGQEIVVRFRGVRVWGGYIANIRREYVFASGTGILGDEPRYLVLDVVDYNVLFNKRIFYDRADPTDMIVRQWPNGTHDNVVIGQVLSEYLDLTADGISSDVQHVGTPALPTVSCNPDAPDRFGVGSAGWTFAEVMNAITSQTGAVYYIDPDKVFRHVDDSTKQSRFGYEGISDAPAGLMIGYRDLEITDDGSRMVNDQMTWGAGQGSDEMAFARVTDATSVATHGLWQGGELRFDMYCQESVELRAETWVYGSPQNRRGGKDPQLVARATVREPFFRVADVLRLESTTFDIDENVPVRASEITFPTPWDIRCVLTLSHQLDAPWNTFEFWLPLLDLRFPQIRGIVEGPVWLDGVPVIPPIPPSIDPCLEIGGIPLAELLDINVPPQLLLAWSSTPGVSPGSSSGSITLENASLAVYIAGINRYRAPKVLYRSADAPYTLPDPPDTLTFRFTLSRVVDQRIVNFFCYFIDAGLSDPPPNFGGDGRNAVGVTITAADDLDNPPMGGIRGNLGVDTVEFYPDTVYNLEALMVPGTMTMEVRWWRHDQTRPTLFNINTNLNPMTTFGLAFGLATQTQQTPGVTFFANEFTKGITVTGAFVGDPGNDTEIPLTSGGDDPCAAAQPGELVEPSTNGAVTGEQAQEGYLDEESGSTFFYLEDQFQKGSTEVWVDGLRIRLGLDYIEYPRTKRIEILDHIVLAAESLVTVNYVTWTIEYPAPTQEPT